MRKPPENLDAWAAYQRGLWHMGKATSGDNALAQKFFQEAIDLGVAFIGRPRVTLTPEPPPGSPLNSPAAMALLAPELAREAARVEQKVDGYRYYPVLSAGISYRF